MTFKLESLAFAFPGNPGAIPLRDPVSSRFLGDEPEWNAHGRSVAVAFVRGSHPKVRAVFSRSPGGDAPVRCRIGARCSDGPGIAECEVTLTFGPTGVSDAHDLALSEPVIDAIGSLTHEFRWYAIEAGVERSLGTTRHEWLRAWRQPVPATDWASPQEPQNGPADQPHATWTYLPLMRWTCEWAAAQGDERKLCDALLESLPKSGLKYAVSAWNVRAMLVKGGGYCGAFYRMFQALAGAQGVKLERRQFAVDWRVEPEQQARWCAIVVETPGLNRKEPAEGPSTFHDVDQAPIAKAPIRMVRTRRYRFWGVPEALADGHSINFLFSAGRWYLYDASFQHRVELEDFTLPPSNPHQAIGTEGLGNFKEAYLDTAVHFMLGSLVHLGKLLQTVHPNPAAPGFSEDQVRNGVTMTTALLPNRDAAITFYWV